MNILIPVTILILILGNITTGHPRKRKRAHKPQTPVCYRVRSNVNYDRDTRRQQPNSPQELGHKFEKVEPNAVTGPCLPREWYEKKQ